MFFARKENTSRNEIVYIIRETFLEIFYGVLFTLNGLVQNVFIKNVFNFY